MPSATFRDAASQSVGEIIVVDPCYWTPAVAVPLQARLGDALGVGRRTDHAAMDRTAAMAGQRPERATGTRTSRSAGRRERRQPTRQHSQLRAIARSRSSSGFPTMSFAAKQVASASRSSPTCAVPAPRLERELLRVSPGIPPCLSRWSMSRQAALGAPSLSQPLLANALRAGDDRSTHSDPPWANMLAVELQADERPPAWLAACGKPVIAIRRGAAYADIRRCAQRLRSPAGRPGAGVQLLPVLSLSRE